MTHQRLLPRWDVLRFGSVLTALVLAGCVAAPGSSGVPGSFTPGTSPEATEGATPSPSSSPSDTPPASPSPSAGSSASPPSSPGTAGCGVATWLTGRTDLVLRVMIAGGLVPPGVDLGRVPMVSVYGDGHVISEGPQIAIYPGPLLPNLQLQVLNAAGMRRLLDAAAAAGLLVPDSSYPSYGIADAPTTFFTLVADGCTHHVDAAALIESDLTTGMDRQTIEARAKLLAFLDSLTDLPTLVGAANVTDGGPYEAPGYRIISRVEPAGTGASATPAPAVKWPLATPLARFGEPLGSRIGDTRCGIATAADAATLKPLFEAANAETRWSSAGKTYSLHARPLFPNESGCNDPMF